MGRADAGGLRVLAEALSEVHAPGDVPERATGQDPSDLDRKDVDELPRGDRSACARPASLARCSRSSRPASRTTANRAATWSGCWRRSRTTRSPSSCGTAASATIPTETLQLLSEHGAALVQIDEPKFRLLDPPEPAAQREDVLLHAAARPERRAVVEPREVRGPLQLPLLGERAGTLRGRGARKRRATSRRPTSTRTTTSRRSRSPTPRRSSTSSDSRSTASIRRRSSSATRT